MKTMYRLLNKEKSAHECYLHTHVRTHRHTRFSNPLVDHSLKATDLGALPHPKAYLGSSFIGPWGSMNKWIWILSAERIA